MTTGRPTTRTGLGRGLLLVSLAGIVWGTIGPAVQLVHEGSGLSPSTISAYRAVAAVAALVVASLAVGRLGSSLRLAHDRPGRVITVGLSAAAFQLLFFVAVVATGVSVTTVVALGLPPVLLLLLGSVQRRRAPSRSQVVTVTTALVGLGLVTIGGGTAEAPNDALGVLAALGSGTAYAVSTHAAAPLSRGYDALTVTTATMSVAAAALIPVGLLTAHVRDEGMTTGDVGSWVLMVYLGVVTMAFAYVLLYAGLRSTTSGSAVVATLLEPVTAVLIAVLLLGERPTAAVVVGMILILAAIATLGRQVEEQPSPQ